MARIGRGSISRHAGNDDNTLLTRSGAHTGLITTEGFEDTLLITRGAYGRWAGLTEDGIKHPVATDRAPALVPNDRIPGVPEYNESRQRYLDRFPSSEQTFTLGDFNVYQLRFESGRYVGGFAQAVNVTPRDLEQLAADEVYEFVFIMTPLKLVGATGSPIRPLAIR